MTGRYQTRSQGKAQIIEDINPTPRKRKSAEPKKKSKRNKKDEEEKVDQEQVDDKTEEESTENKTEEKPTQDISKEEKLNEDISKEKKSENALEKESSLGTQPSKTLHDTSKILEKGLIYFFYRPKVDAKEVTDIDDVARLYILLRPHVFDTPAQLKEQQQKKINKNDCRLIGISKKKLPGIKDHSKFWAFVIKSAPTVDEIVKTELEEKDYQTKTLGLRHLQSMRPVGEGVYAIVTHGDHTHLAYVLELPTELGTVQKAFQIGQQGSYIISVKNPEEASMIGSWSKDVEYPEQLKKVFVGKRDKPTKWHKVDPVELINYQGAEMLIVGAKEDIVEELGEAGEYLEELRRIDVKDLSDDKLFEELHLDKKKHSPKPLLSGGWN